MTASGRSGAFDRLHSQVRQSDISGRTLLIPLMAPAASRLIAASFRAVGVNAIVLESYTGLALGKEFTSGKECFPCQVTAGDILYHLQNEKERLGQAFDPARYAFFMPEAEGPCRFGMYNKLQRLILDRFEDFKEVPIAYLSTRNSYGSEGIMPPERASVFRKLSYVSVIIADVLDRTVWRVRPYEWRPGLTDAFMETALQAMEAAIEAKGGDLCYHKLYDLLEDIVSTAAGFVNPRLPRRPRIGIIGEIYLRSHPQSNQDIVRRLERFGAEVVDASIGEWVNFVSYDRGRRLKHQWQSARRRGDGETVRSLAKSRVGNAIEQLWQAWRQSQAFGRALRHLDIQPDHSIATVECRLENAHLFDFTIGTEAALSIGGALEYVHGGFDGIVNVFPFTCMPSTIAAAVLKPLLHQKRIPFIDAPYDGTIQPNREVALRTFVYQATQRRDARLAAKEP